MDHLARSPKQIGNIVRRARKALGMSQSELGSRTGLRQATVSLVETGNPAVRLDTLLTILGALDLEFRIGPRRKAGPHDVDLEDLFR